MTESELKLFIGNRLSNLYVTIERLLRNNNPRGLFNDYEDSVSEITQLLEFVSLPEFLALYKSEIKNQSHALRNTDVFIVASKIAGYDSPALLKKWVNSLFIDNLPAFIVQEIIYINELLRGRSRKSTKTDYLIKNRERVTFTKSLLPQPDRDSLLGTTVRDFETFLDNEIARL